MLVAQSVTARALDAPETNERFAKCILIRHTLSAWRMLVSEVSLIPCRPSPQGTSKSSPAAAPRRRKV
ncbi:hypothetical protein SALBM311S_09964 [Streptomyces alboniger]